MTKKTTSPRIIPELRSRDLEATKAFYCKLLGLELGMEDGDFLMLNSPTNPSAQLTVNDNGYPSLPPGFAVDVGSAERVRELYNVLTQQGFALVERLEDKPWGIRRFSVIDPNGARVTLIGHLEA
jgi:catechol 2,3-dioxygenase-like lactoylglutathione lyase family enzyme